MIKKPEPLELEYDIEFMPILHKRLVACEHCKGKGYAANAGIGMLKKEVIMCVACAGLGSLLDGEIVLDDEIIKLYRSYQIQTARTYCDSLKNRNKSLLSAALAGPQRVNEWIKNNQPNQKVESRGSGPDLSRNKKGVFGAMLTLD